jgi:4-carboxymuconolactone decarboxylase
MTTQEPRLRPLSENDMTPEQRRVGEIISGTRKGLGGPFSVWVRTPDIAEPANLLHNAFRLDGKLDRRHFEMLILLVAREFGAKYVWTFHVGQALKAGLERSMIDAIRDGDLPDFAEPAAKLVYDLVRELLVNKTLSDASFKAGMDVLGDALLIELVSAVGFYSTVCLLVNSFDVPPPKHGPDSSTGA